MHKRMSAPPSMLAVWLSLVLVAVGVLVPSAAGAFVPSGFAPHGGDYLQEMVEGGVFRWPANNLPLRVYIGDGDNVSAYRPQYKQLMRDAFNAWMEAANGKLSWQEVSDPRQADIVTTWSDDISIRNGQLEAGRTTAITELDRRTRQRYLRAAEIRILTRIGRKIFTEDDIRKTTLHEVGHALGLQGHSRTSSDIMYASLSRSQVPYLQDRDATTIKRLYADYPKAGTAGSAVANRPAPWAQEAPRVTMTPRRNGGRFGRQGMVPGYRSYQNDGAYRGGGYGGYGGGYGGPIGGYAGASNAEGYGGGGGFDGGYSGSGNYGSYAPSGGYSSREATLRAVAEELARRIYNSRNPSY